MFGYRGWDCNDLTGIENWFCNFGSFYPQDVVFDFIDCLNPGDFKF